MNGPQLHCPECHSNDGINLLSTAVLSTPITVSPEGAATATLPSECDWSNAEPLVRNGEMVFECETCKAQFTSSAIKRIEYDN